MPIFYFGNAASVCPELTDREVGKAARVRVGVRDCSAGCFCAGMIVCDAVLMAFGPLNGPGLFTAASLRGRAFKSA